MPSQNNELNGQLVTRPNGAIKVPTAFFFGKIIGRFKDHPIYDQLTDNHGVVRSYGGIASTVKDCKPGSMIAGPGILYEMA